MSAREALTLGVSAGGEGRGRGRKGKMGNVKAYILRTTVTSVLMVAHRNVPTVQIFLMQGEVETH